MSNLSRTRIKSAHVPHSDLSPRMHAPKQSRSRDDSEMTEPSFHGFANTNTDNNTNADPDTNADHNTNAIPVIVPLWRICYELGP